MKIEVKKFQHINVGFDGGVDKYDLYLDGVLRAHVETSATGGPTNYAWVRVEFGGKPFTTMQMPDDVKAFVAAQPKFMYHGHELAHDMDTLTEPAITAFEVEKKIRAACKKVMCVSNEGDPAGTFRKYKVPYTPALAADYRRRNPKGVIYNETLAA